MVTNGLYTVFGLLMASRLNWNPKSDAEEILEEKHLVSLGKNQQQWNLVLTVTSAMIFTANIGLIIGVTGACRHSKPWIDFYFSVTCIASVVFGIGTYVMHHLSFGTTMQRVATLIVGLINLCGLYAAGVAVKDINRMAPAPRDPIDRRAPYPLP